MRRLLRGFPMSASQRVSRGFHRPRTRIKGGFPIMLQRTARLLALAIVLAVGFMVDWPRHKAQAEQVHPGPRLDLDYALATPRDIKKRVRKPALMPPTPNDFGPHFGFPAGGSQNFNCGPGYGYYCG